MDCFPSDVRFRASWRDYQIRVLDELKNHIKDGRLHVVAAPGSGKTVLGLEVIRRLNRPALVLVPTRTIREQWVDRLAHFFLPEQHVPDWVSIDLWRPGLLTVATYQALHTAIAGEDAAQDEQEEENDINSVHVSEDDIESSADSGAALVSVLRQAGIRALVVDEAHHLRAEWWKSLI